MATDEAPTDAPRHVDERHVAPPDDRHVARRRAEPSPDMSADHGAKPTEQMPQAVPPRPQAVTPQAVSPQPQAVTSQTLSPLPQTVTPQAVTPQTVADLRSLVRQYEQALSDDADAEIERALAGVGDALRAYEEAARKSAVTGDERVA